MDSLESSEILENFNKLRQSKSDLEKKYRRITQFYNQVFDIKESVRGLYKEEFFNKVLETFSKETGLEYFFLSYIDKENSTFKLLSNSYKGNTTEHFTCNMNCTKCDVLRSSESKIVKEQAGEDFPTDCHFSDKLIESYISVPLFNSKEEKIGVVAGLSSSKLENGDFKLAMLQYFEDRIATELERYIEGIQKISDHYKDTINQISQLSTNHISTVEDTKTESEIEDIYAQKEKELNDLRSAFVSLVSHQYRTPLTVIQTSTELLGMFFKAQNEAKHDEFRKKIFTSINKMTDMIDKITLLGDFEHESTHQPKESFDFIELLNYEIDKIKTYDDNKHIIDLIKNTNTIRLHSYKFLFAEVINNLLTNAVKYSPHDTKITVKVTDQENSIKIEVTDDGIGIPEEDIPKIFDHFYRCKNAIDTYGIGVGLSIVKRFLNKLNASIDVNSNLNSGTTFAIEIPKENTDN